MPDRPPPSVDASDRPPLRDGYTDIPPGHIAAIATTLEMRARPSADPASAPSPLALRHVRAPDLDWYRGLFRRIGEPWLWQSRLRLSDEVLRGIVHDDGVEIWAVSDGVEDVGLIELDFRAAGACELAFLGVTVPWTGRGAGTNLMRHIMQRAWTRPIDRLWVHTCTLDDPRALGFYIRSGFRPIKRQVEIAVDPRLDGTLSADARPDVPVIR